jgi:hypothetical protein
MVAREGISAFHVINTRIHLGKTNRHVIVPRAHAVSDKISVKKWAKVQSVVALLRFRFLKR